VNAEQFEDWLQSSQSPASSLLKKPLIMGVLNITTDSFSDGGFYLSVEKACEHAHNLINQGADIIDVGGESTKPGAVQVPLDIEIARVIPVIQALRKHTDICISIDTYKPEVMKAAVEAGANLINDIYALRKDNALSIASQLSVPVCLMHMQGQPQSMQNSPYYPRPVVDEIVHFFNGRIKACLAAGIAKNHLILDPGFGFGKLVEHNMSLLRHIEKLQQFSLPLLLGVSRKSTLGILLNKKVNERMVGGIAIAVYAVINGVNIVRTHDVDETSQALKIIDAIYHTA
jgi:dihydropteroate synthase